MRSSARPKYRIQPAEDKAPAGFSFASLHIIRGHPEFARHSTRRADDPQRPSAAPRHIEEDRQQQQQSRQSSSTAGEHTQQRRRPSAGGSWTQAEHDTSSGAADPAAPAPAPSPALHPRPGKAGRDPAQPRRNLPSISPESAELYRDPAARHRLPVSRSPPASRHIPPIRPKYPRIPRAQPSRPAYIPIILYIYYLILCLYLHPRIPYKDRPPERIPALHPLPGAVSRVYRPPPLDPLPPIL